VQAVACSGVATSGASSEGAAAMEEPFLGVASLGPALREAAPSVAVARSAMLQ
jgi:hypothetical protein